MNEQSLLMTWHEPDKGEKDPWRKHQNNPPDLDQLIRKFWAQLMAFFGGKEGSGGSGSDTSNFGKFGLQIILGVLILLYAVTGIYIVEPAERAVITRLGKYVRTEGPGPHWVPRFIETVHLVNVERQESSTHGGLMLTQDENLVFVEVSIQYRIGNGEKDARDYLFQVSRPIDSVKQATESALRQAIGHSNLDEILTSGRAQIAETIKKQVEEILANYHTGVYVSDVVMQPAKAPEEVKNAFDDVIKAREERESFVNKAEAYANEIEAKAKGQAQRLIEDALAYKQEQILLAEGNAARFNLILPQYKQSPKVTQTRIYLDAIETILSRSNKILVDVGDGNKNFIYLPIEQFLKTHPTDIQKEFFQPSLKPSFSGGGAKNGSVAEGEQKEMYRDRHNRERTS